ncbi:unnamed protein product [Closterium sp. NIES-54]
MDVWGPARFCGQGHERYFLLVVDDYSRYTTVFPLRSKGDVTEGIRQTFTLPASPQQNGIAERRIGMVMDVARTSMIHAAAPHFLWPFAVQYAAHQINLQPRVSLTETTPTLRWMGKVGDASAFHVWGSRAFVRDTSADKLSSRAVPCGPAPSGVSQVDPAEPVEVGIDSGAARGAEPAGAGTVGAEPGDAEPERVESGGSLGVPLRREPLSPQRLRESYARRCCCAAGDGAAGAAGGAVGDGASGGAAGAGAAGAAGPGGACTGGTGASWTGGTASVGAAGTEAGGATGVVTGDPGAEGTCAVSGVSGGAARPRPYYVPLLLQVLGLPPSPGPPPPLLSPQPVHSESLLQPSSPPPGPSPYCGPTRVLTERCEPESRPVSPMSCVASPVCTARAGRVLRPRPPPIPGTHSMTLRPSLAPQRVPLPSPPASSLPDGPDPESDSLRAASSTVTRFLATAVTDPLFESIAASALVAELVDFAAACRLDYATSLVGESASASVCPLSARGECPLSTDDLEDRQEEFECFAPAVPHLVSMLLSPEGDPDALDLPTPRSYAEAIEGSYSSHWQAAMDAEMASWKSTGTYVDEVPPPGANIVSGMWIFSVKRPPGSPPVFKARYVARGFSQRQGVDLFQTFSPTPKMTTLRDLLHVAAQHDYELHSLDFSTAFVQGGLHEEIWLRRLPGFTGSFPAGTQWSLRRPVYGLRQAPCEWHYTPRTTLAALGFAPSTADPSLFLRIDTTLPPFYVLVYVDDLVFATADTEALAHVKSELQKRHTCTDLEPSGPYPELVGCLMVLRYLCSTSGIGLVLGGRARVVLTGHADASWELCWLTYLLTDLGEAPRSPPVLYVDNKAMLVLCEEHRLEHRTKHIALRYFLARKLSQRGQLCLAYVASQANTADVFTKAFQPCDHQRFCTVLGLPVPRHRQLRGGDDGSSGYGMQGSKRGRGRGFGGAGRGAKKDDDSNDQQGGTGWGRGAKSGRGGKSDLEGRPVAFDTWHDDLQLYLLSDSRDSVSLFDHVSGAAPAPPATADVSTRSQCLSRDATARLAIRNHLPATECAHFGEHRTAQALYDTVVAHYSSPATAAIGRLLLPYLFPELSAFATVADLVTHLRTSKTMKETARGAGVQRVCRAPAGADAMVTTSTPGGQRVSICTCTRPGRSLATFTRRPGSSLYTLATEPPQVAASTQVSASGQVVASCTCRLLSHQTLLWHHRLGHPSLPCLRGMHSRLLVSGLPRSLPPLPPSPAPPCLLCVEGQQRAAPHSSSFPPTTAPLQTLHMDVWGQARVSGQGRERYFLLVVDDDTR